MTRGATSVVPDGAAIFPSIPLELGIHPLTLAVLHALVFLGGSDAAIVNPLAADETLLAIAGYLQRIKGRDRDRLKADLKVLGAYARKNKWPRQQQDFLKNFLVNMATSG